MDANKPVFDALNIKDLDGLHAALKNQCENEVWKLLKPNMTPEEKAKFLGLLQMYIPTMAPEEKTEFIGIMQDSHKFSQEMKK